jgi:HAD superfamily hydrolase (TIGR01509 family)
VVPVVHGDRQKLDALIFDCDGVLADTERYGHLVAFNQMFAEFGVPARWSEKEYGERLKIGGGKERLWSLLTPSFVAAAGLPRDLVQLEEVVARWHRRKTEIYGDIVRRGKLPPRPGVARIAEEAHAAGVQLAVASTSSLESVCAVLMHAVGRSLASEFTVFAGDVVPRKKPAPDIYELAIDRLDVAPSRTLVIEDSRNGLIAATRAGLACVVTVSDYTRNENFKEARMVVTDLGDPAGAPTDILQNDSLAHPGAFVTLADLTTCVGTGLTLDRRAHERGHA